LQLADRGITGFAAAATFEREATSNRRGSSSSSSSKESEVLLTERQKSEEVPGTQLPPQRPTAAAASTDVAAVLTVDVSNTANNELDMDELLRKEKCTVQNCPKRFTSAHIFECFHHDYNRKVHLLCYQEIILPRAKKSSAALKDEDVVFCTITCQDKYIKDSSVDNLNWTNDGAGGKDDKKHSQYYLIEWLSENWDKWKDQLNNNGPARTKLVVAAVIAEEIFKHGVKVKRNALQVKAKIQTIEEQMKNAYSIATGKNTGYGLTEEDLLKGVDTIDNKVCRAFVSFDANH
jgi:hypothetical protein